MKSILKIQNISVDFIMEKKQVPILNKISLEVKENEVIALIGESGCGKSVMGNTILHLLPKNAVVSGEIWYKENKISEMKEREFRALRGKEIAWIPQSAGTSLNPLLSIGDQTMECLLTEKKEKKKEKVKDLFSKLSLFSEKSFYKTYPCELSGGIRQRVLIAMGIIAEPKLLIVDEPTKGIDWIHRKEVVSILQKWKEETNGSMLLITHDLGVAKQIADQIAVMYCGEIVEMGSTEEILKNPLHPYTEGLIRSLPSKGFHVMDGFMPSFQRMPERCRFQPRCTHICTGDPYLYFISENHMVYCNGRSGV